MILMVYSEDTVQRARDAGVELLTSDVALVQQCAVILSVVPPRDAQATADRIITALSQSGGKREQDLFYADLNAVSPMTVKRIAAAFVTAKAPVRFIDGSILGHPPRRRTGEPSNGIAASDESDTVWDRPRIPVSGPHSLDSLPGGDGARMASVLNFRSISAEVGAASGLKMCFGAMSKGVTAIMTQSFATAHSLGVAEDLKEELGRLMPAHLNQAVRGVPSMPPKAYRWVREMEEMADTFSEVGGWSPLLFQGAATVYRDVAADEVLGQEKVGKRKRGTTVEDVAKVMSEGLEKKRKKDA